MKRNIEVPTLEHPLFTLRSFQESDAEALQMRINDERVARKVSNIPYPYTIAHARAWIEQTESVITETSLRVDFAIEINGSIAGSVAFINIDDHKAQVSYWLSPHYWGAGIMTKAVSLLIRFGFEQMRLVRIFGYVYRENSASARVLEKAGFTLEGIHRKEWHKVIDGKDMFFDSVYFAIVRDVE